PDFYCHYVAPRALYTLSLHDALPIFADLPGQIASCREHLAEAGYADRASFHEFSILERDAVLPSGHDVIWMSQFLCCFSEDEVVDRKSTRLNSSHVKISYAVFCLKKK